MSRRAIAALIAVVLLVATTACRHPDSFNGCSRHPGQCDRTR